MLLDGGFLVQLATAETRIRILTYINRLDFNWHIFSGSWFLHNWIILLMVVIFGFLLGTWLLLLSVLEYMELSGVRNDIDIVCLGPGWWLGLIDYEWRLS